MLVTCAKLFGRVVSPMACVLKGLFLATCFLLLLVTCVTLPLCLPCGARCAVAVCPPLCCCLARCFAAPAVFVFLVVNWTGAYPCIHLSVSRIFT